MASLVTVEDAQVRGGGLETVPPDRLGALLEDASDLVRLVAETDFLDTEGALVLPEGITAVVLQMVRRAVYNPAGVQQEQQGPFGWQSPGQQGIYVTRREAKIIRKAAGTAAGLGTLQLEGDIAGIPALESLDDVELNP